jgi:hypothetical protein
MLVEMHGRGTGANVCAVIAARNRIDRVLPKKAFLRREFYRFSRRVRKGEFVKANRAIHVENDAAGILANGLRLGFGEGDVLLDDLHRTFGNSTLLLALKGSQDSTVHVIGNFSRSAPDKFQ